MTPWQAEAVFWLLGVPFVMVLIGMAWLRYDAWRGSGR